MYFFTIFPRTLPLLNNDKTSSTLDIVGALDRSLKAMFVNKCLGKCLCNSEKNQQKRRSISKFSEVQYSCMVNIHCSLPYLMLKKLLVYFYLINACFSSSCDSQ